MFKNQDYYGYQPELHFVVFKLSTSKWPAEEGEINVLSLITVTVK